MKIRKLISIIAIPAFVAASFSSCEPLLTPDADEVLLPEDVYRNIDDADAAIRGIYGKLMDLAPQYIVLNELRADLMDVTAHADLSLIELSEHRSVSNDNPWASPRLFFSLINSCNDALYQFGQMVEKNRISRELADVRYSEAMAIRCWAYLQVSLHFADPEKGGVPYITEPLNSIESLDPAYLEKFPYLDLPTMIDSLLFAMESIPYKDLITDEGLITIMDGYNTDLMYIDKQYLLGELNLWKGNYHQAAVYFKTIMERGVSGNDLYDLHKLPFDASATLDVTTSRYNSGYVRFYNNDRLSAKNMWPTMFYETQTNNYHNEWIWVLYFDELYEPNSLVDLFAKDGGSYLLKPSNLAITNWNKQVQLNTFAGDFRGYYFNYFGLPGSFDIVDNEPVIMKHIYRYSQYNPDFNPSEKIGKWHLWRSGSLHLRYSEAANRDGQHRIAYSILNNGIRANYPGADTTAAANDYTKRQQTFLDFPYDFDARTTGISDVPPNLRQPWFRNMGVRGRVYLQPLEVTGDSLTVIESQILDECALELAFEGQRWGDLVRMSLRNNNPSILADKVAEKLILSGKDGEAVRQKLMDRKNWFLPLQ
ncbi:MAG TPA: RagB/SusD family nutrient uptake outer membrane protein [Prolixibacteraceae bacterium]|nr:RagB/SusD family nutrient uptake outer membrane protein [Prolixibacteraceae bacterium]